MRVVVASLIAASLCAVALSYPTEQRDLDSAVSQIDDILSAVQKQVWRQEALKTRQAQQVGDLDALWVVLNTILIFGVVAGFAVLESGSVNGDVVAGVHAKYIITVATSALGWWFLGYGVAFGDSRLGNRNGFIGNNDILLSSGGRGFTNYGVATYEWVLCAISSIVVTNSVTQRISLKGYFFIALAWSIFIYPVGAKWAWSTTGWLSPFNTELSKLDQGLLDSSGTAVVHLTAAGGALAALVVLGGKTHNTERRDRTYSLLGLLLIWFGYYGYTTQLGLAGEGATSNAATCGKIIAVVTLCAATSGLSAGLTDRLFISGKVDNRVLSHGVVSGLVAISSGCNVVELYAGCLIGLVTGFVFAFSQRLFAKLGFADALDAVSVHGVSAVWGLIATSLWATDYDTHRTYGSTIGDISQIRYGIFYGGGAQTFGVHLVAIVVYALWGFGLTFIGLTVLDKLGLLRASPARAKALTFGNEPVEAK